MPAHVLLPWHCMFRRFLYVSQFSNWFDNFFGICHIFQQHRKKLAKIACFGTLFNATGKNLFAQRHCCLFQKRADILQSRRTLGFCGNIIYSGSTPYTHCTLFNADNPRKMKCNRGDTILCSRRLQQIKGSLANRKMKWISILIYLKFEAICIRVVV